MYNLYLNDPKLLSIVYFVTLLSTGSIHIITYQYALILLVIHEYLCHFFFKWTVINQSYLTLQTGLTPILFRCVNIAIVPSHSPIPMSHLSLTVSWECVRYQWQKNMSLRHPVYIWYKDRAVSGDQITSRQH